MIHEAGPLVDAVQRCVRCQVILTDYRGAMVPNCQAPLTGFEEGAHVEMQVFDFFRSQSVVEDPPDCEVLS